MVASALKTPRHKLTDNEKRVCREAILSERHARRVRRAEEKDSEAAPKKKASRKKAMKLTTPAMEHRNAAVDDPDEVITQRISPVESKEVDEEVPCDEAEETTAHCEPDVAETVAEMVTEIPESFGTPEPVIAAVSQVETEPGAASKKRRRAVLQSDSDSEDEPETPAPAETESGENDFSSTYVIPGGIVDADPNLMDRGADQCTGLNSDEYTDLQDEPEDEDDADDDVWKEDWDIGVLSDEDLDEELPELPDSIWLSAAKNKRLMSEMRESGWEYDTSKFGPDPTYEGLTDGPYGPTSSVLEVAEDPLALFFYFLPPKLWRQIVVESNRYHTQSIPLRARSIRSQQRRNGAEVEDLADIRGRLSKVLILRRSRCSKW